jgi:tRNA(fMet)-specific endonuclease VapC
MKQRLYILDTNVLLQLIRGGVVGTHVRDKFDLTKQTVRPILCAVTLGEIWAIAKRHTWGKEKRERLETAISESPVVEVSEPAVVQAYVDIQVGLQKSGRSLGENDLWIAAAAKANDAYLLTTDKPLGRLTCPRFMCQLL